MAERISFVVRGFGGRRSAEFGFRDVIETAERVPRQHAGWRSVRYHGRRYRLAGGTRTVLFINLRNPIGPRVRAFDWCNGKGCH